MSKGSLENMRDYYVWSSDASEGQFGRDTLRHSMHLILGDVASPD